MLKIITSVVLSLVTIMAVTLFAVTVPAHSQKIDDNAAAIEYNETYIKTVDDALENLQDAFDGLDAKKIYIYGIEITGSTDDDFFNAYIYFNFITNNQINPDNIEQAIYEKFEDYNFPAVGYVEDIEEGAFYPVYSCYVGLYNNVFDMSVYFTTDTSKSDITISKNIGITITVQYYI